MNKAVVTFRLGQRWLMVRAPMVREFLASTTWLSVPGSTPLMPGVMTWRGRAIPVLDLARALDLGTLSPLAQNARVMVLEHAAGAVAVPVDAAREVTSVAEEDIRPPHVAAVPYSVGEVDGSDAVIPIIEIERLLRELGRSGGTA